MIKKRPMIRRFLKHCFPLNEPLLPQFHASVSYAIGIPPRHSTFNTDYQSIFAEDLCIVDQAIRITSNRMLA